MKLLSFVLFVTLTTCLTEAFNVLGVLPFTSKSHFTIGHAILKSLTKAGHQVTVISPYPQKNPLENYHDVDVSSVLDQFLNDKFPNPFLLREKTALTLEMFLYQFGIDLVDAYMNHPAVLEFLSSGKQFDVCIIEMFLADAFLGIADHFDCVLITYTTFGAVKWIDHMTSNQSPYSYVPHPFLSYTETMSFSERLWNTIHSHVENIIYEFYHLPNQRRLYNKYFPHAKKSFDETYKSSAIIFLNNHVSASSARPYLPNMIEIAGVHVEPAKPLPNDIKEFLDSATDGAVLFSMGSIIQAVQWPEDKREAFVKAFGKLKQKVLWKYENETLPNSPKNVKISSWIPQRDILAHPNVKLFITHGGLLGASEAMREGVPLLGIPIFGDQKMNMAKAVSRRYGKQILFDEISEENLDEALDELLNNPEFENNAKTISSRYNDRPMTSQESVVFWTEYAVRHKGVPHFKAAGNSLGFIEFHLIDVYLTILAIGLFGLFVLYKIIKFTVSLLFKGKSKNIKKKKN